MRLPSLRSLEAALAVARLGSLAAAGDEIAMSVPALSRRIAQLESDLEVRLFDRVSRGVVVTPAGEAFLARVAPVLAELRQASREARGEHDHVVRLSTVPTFATRWLLPRLNRFERENPDIEVDVQTSAVLEDLDARNLDAVIRLSTSTAEATVPTLPIHLYPVWSPDHLSGISDAADLLRHRLLGPNHRPEFWQEWLEAHPLDHGEIRIRPVDSVLLYERTLRGDGIAIGIEPLVTPLIEQGRLVGLTLYRVSSGRAFHLIERGGQRSRPAQRVLSWLRQEFAKSAHPPRAAGSDGPAAASRPAN
ncbi:LysR substrate-binding domain-containing protein [Pseudomonas sp. NY15437]|uniref:LysR substrate-binding domain-containing protein n=1 Tax=Pseudomonas sp. NY15437 TaxID=3400360 RepID=UPI003A8B22D5